jgi:serine/threonine-protein kinase
MKTIPTLLLILAGLIQSAGVVSAQTKESPPAPNGPPGPRDSPAQLAAQVKDIFRMHCWECHGGTSKKSGLDIFDHARMLKKETVIPGKPEDSPLFSRVSAPDTDGSIMPPKGQPRLSPDEIARVRQWISIGAPVYPADVARPVLEKKEKEGVIKGVGVEYVLQHILLDVRKTLIEDRRYKRYFSINHILMSPEGASPQALDLQRDALAKAINHLSWRKALARPVPIDAAKTVFVIDLRDLGWELQPYDLYNWHGRDKTGKRSRVDLFDLALLDYPYGIVYENSPTFDYLLNEFIIPSGMVRPIAYVRADWFVSTITLPPFYEDFLQLPFELKYLEDKLGVDARANLKNYVAQRAGMSMSGVSRNNRIVERHPGQYGAYWKSLDFRTNLGFENIFRDPVYPHIAGGEMVFTLPNGLNGYFVTNNRGLRIEEAPTNIVTDKFATDHVVRPGLSCMRCHVQGIVSFEDNVRATLKRLPNSYNYFDKFFALKLYPEKSVMDRWVDEDQARFVGSMSNLFGRPWKGAQASPLTPVSQQYLDFPLHLQKAAGELGLLYPGDIEALVRSRSLSHLGLSPLAVPGGLIRRDTWEDYFDVVVKEVGLGIPIVPLDGVARRNFPVAFEDSIKVDLKTNKKNNTFAPGDDFFIAVKNHSHKPIYVELIGTDAQGRKVILTYPPIQVKAGETYKTKTLKIRGQLGKEQITLFASYYDFPGGQLLRGKDYYSGEYGTNFYVSDRVIHSWYGYQRGGHRWPINLDGAGIVKKTIDVETK